MDKLKYIAAVMLLFMVSFVGGCVGADAKTAEADEQDRMKLIQGSESAYGVNVFEDTETGVQYAVFNGYKAGGICVMVDAEGKPLMKARV